MGLLNKIMTAIRGGVREVGETIVDANSIRIFEQEIKDAQHNLQQAKQDLTTVMAQEMQVSRKIGEIEKDIVTYENYAIEALAKNNETLALEVATKIGTLQDELHQQQQAKTNFSNHSERLKGLIQKTSVALADMDRQLVMVKTTQSVQKATAAISNNSAASSSKLLSAKESLTRIQQRQQQLDDKLAAGDLLDKETNSSSLDDKLRQSGIGQNSQSAQDIISSLKRNKLLKES